MFHLLEILLALLHLIAYAALAVLVYMQVHDHCWPYVLIASTAAVHLAALISRQVT